MVDQLKINDLSVGADVLLTNERLLFPLLIDEQTGAELLDRKRTAVDRGLTFTLVPRQNGTGYRVELNGSIHRFSRGGTHNADQFTAADLLTALDDLITTYGINPFTSRLNNLEFGINLALPFPAAELLRNLIMYKYRPFVKEQGSEFTYYQCLTQRYVVKLYAKGEQYPRFAPGIAANLLRVEVKVIKMEYLTRRGVRLDDLSDLLNVNNYGTLGALLVEVFSEILFDEPTIDPARLSVRQRDVYQNGRNPRFWSIPDHLAGKEYSRQQKSLKRSLTAFRALLDQHRAGANWQQQTAALIAQTWYQLTRVNNDLLHRMTDRRAVWADLCKGRETVVECPKLTGVDTSLPTERMSQINSLGERLISDNSPERTRPDPIRETVAECPILTGPATHPQMGEMSEINHLSVGLISDNASRLVSSTNSVRETVQTQERNSAAAAAALSACSNELPTGTPPQRALLAPPPERVGNHAENLASSTRAESAMSSSSTSNTGRPTASALRADENLLTTIEQRRRRYAKGSKESPHERAAHNLRNDDSNPRNNLARRVRRLLTTSTGQTLQLFAAVEVVRLTPEHRTTLDYWQGTRYEIRL